MSFYLPESETRLARYYAEPIDDVAKEFYTHGVLGDDLRPQAQYQYAKDYDRLLYSSAFRRLGGVTQVVTSDEMGDFHNRLTHSLKVAQTGVRASSWLLRNATSEEKERIGSYGGLHPNVVRAACLAHDFGHPPFGHVGEEALQAIADNPAAHLRGYPEGAGALPSSFEGNAQSFRIVTRLSFRQEIEGITDEPSLNLTRATLCAISKYPWLKSDSIGVRLKGGKKWGAYSTEKRYLEWAFDGMCQPRGARRFGKDYEETRTIEGQMMDWADDIAYAVHDIEDFYRAGLIPLHRITRYAGEYDRFVEYAYHELKDEKSLPHLLKDNGSYARREATLGECRDVLNTYEGGIFGGVPWNEYDGSILFKKALHQYSARLIRMATSNLSVTKAGVLQPRDPRTYLAIEVLKKLTPHYVIQKPWMASAQLGQKRIVVELVSSIWEWAISSGALGKEDRLPEIPSRLVDFISIGVVDMALAASQATDVKGGEDPLAGVSRELRMRRLVRSIIDFVASLTDSQARAFHGRLRLGSSTSMLDTQLF